VVCADPGDLDDVSAVVERVAGARPALDLPTRSITAPTDGGAGAVAALAGELAVRGIAVEDLGLRQPTLDDVFLTLTGAPAATDGPGPETGEFPATEPEAAEARP